MITRINLQSAWLRYTLGLTVALGLTCTAQAVIEKPTRISNDDYHFAFTVESNCEVTYQEGGIGFSASHLPAGSDPEAKGVKPDYGLLVYGADKMQISKAEATKARFPPFVEKRFVPSDLPEGVDVYDVITAVMSLNKREVSGQATVKVEGGKSIQVPYFKWNQKVAGQSRNALMYVVPHDNAFIYIQAESKRPFTKEAEAWFTTKLELLKLPEAKP